MDGTETIHGVRGARLGAVLFDANGDEIRGGGPPYCSLSWHETSGFYRSGRDLDLRDAVTVVFGPEVDRVYLGVVGGRKQCNGTRDDGTSGVAGEREYVTVSQVEYFIVGGSAIRRVLNVAGAAGLDIDDPVSDVEPASDENPPDLPMNFHSQ